ncbi:hypothetical protein DENSPDRAFT_836383 [Dentipellis sp. KUC8613]|nr:hypothetical protein DENSPDRAFT_836383 [Dentipellis sp. KUC8613]
MLCRSTLYALRCLDACWNAPRHLVVGVLFCIHAFRATVYISHTPPLFRPALALFSYIHLQALDIDTMYIEYSEP